MYRRYVHRQLKALLRDAEGSSHFVVAIFVDIRGFSSFAKMAESVEATVFLKCVNTKIIDEYFSEASFFKLNGDGMLLIIEYRPGQVGDAVNYAVDSSLRLVHDFPALTDDEPMVNFDTPNLLGVGVARGAATRLDSGDLILDYIGRPLNLAARLIDLARPSGVAFDQSLGPDLLKPDLLSQFTTDQAYLKGIAEAEPLKVWIASERTVVSPPTKQPIS